MASSGVEQYFSGSPLLNLINQTRHGNRHRETNGADVFLSVFNDCDDEHSYILLLRYMLSLDDLLRSSDSA